MSAKIKISYEHEEELAGVIRLLSPIIKSWKTSENKEGRYKKAYVELRENTGKKIIDWNEDIWYNRFRVNRI